MTRATAHAIRRVVTTTDGEMVAEITDRTLALRPLRSRRGGPGEVVVLWGSIYLRAMLARVEEKKREKRKGKKRHVNRRHL